MTQEVKLHILPLNHTGPVMEEPGDGPSLRGISPWSLVRMALHEGTLYADYTPHAWTACDHDRASALGYGPSEPWPEFPTPDPIKPGPVTQYLNPKPHEEMTHDQKIAATLKALGPEYAITLDLTAPKMYGIHRRGQRNGISMAAYTVDARTPAEIVGWIKIRLP